MAEGAGRTYSRRMTLSPERRGDVMETRMSVLDVYFGSR